MGGVGPESAQVRSILSCNIPDQLGTAPPFSPLKFHSPFGPGVVTALGLIVLLFEPIFSFNANTRRQTTSFTNSCIEKLVRL